ncbi:MAG: hypothetical protein ACOX8Q_09665 [Christensenellales bacterium]
MLQAIITHDEYQIASNFIAFNDLSIGEGYTKFERYETVKQRIGNNNRILTEE